MLEPCHVIEPIYDTRFLLGLAWTVVTGLLGIVVWLDEDIGFSPEIDYSLWWVFLVIFFLLSVVLFLVLIGG